MFLENLFMKDRFLPFLLLVAVLLGIGCEKEEAVPSIELFSAMLNGATLTNGLSEVPLSSTLTLVFSSAIDPAKFEEAFALSPAPQELSFRYENQSSKVVVDLSLALQTTYQFTIARQGIGQNGGQLETDYSRSFSTVQSEVITSLPPCTSATNDCLQAVSVAGTGSGVVQFYGSFPIFEEQANWQELKAAVVVVHGANRDADNYFTILNSTLQALDLSDEVVLLAPAFRNEQEATDEELYWTNTGWRAGNSSLESSAVSSFTVVDQLLEQLADREHFPVLEKVIITGHSSGGLFTHLYAAANEVEDQYPELSFTYVSANSQYFYYPDGRRINEATNDLYTPTDCTGYDIYPLGYNIVPAYLSSTTSADYNSRFLNRALIYLLGNGNGSDPALNTTDCSATLLGSSRYQRGENMYRYLELAFPAEHQHQRQIVEGIGHNGQGMYQSPEFRALLQQILN